MKALLLLLALLLSVSAHAQPAPFGMMMNQDLVSATISGLSLSNTSFTGGAPSGTVVGALSVTVSPGSFTGSYSIQTTGNDHSGVTCTTAGNNFTPFGSNLVTSGVVPAGSYAGVCVVATQALARPFVQAFTITGSSVVASNCDYGPQYTGTLPTSVTNSGNTHCVLNADFTTSTTDSHGINYSNISTFIVECGGPNHTYDFHVLWFYNVTDRNPCPGGGNNVSSTSDPLGGGFNVLHLQYSTADESAFQSACGSNCAPSYKYDNILLTWPAVGQGSPGLPYELYVETTIYMPTSTMCHGTSGHQAGLAPNSTDISAAGAGSSLRVDQFEINANPFDSCGSSWSWTSGFGAANPDGSLQSCGGCGAATQPGFNFADGYHAIGQLITSNEVDNVSICSFIDGGSPKVCNTGTLSARGVTACSGGGYSCYFGKNTQVLFEFLPIGVTCFPWTFAGNPSGNPVQACLHNNIDFYYKSLRVFSCANYATPGSCAGPVITSDAAPEPKRYANDDTSPEGLIREALAWLFAKAA